MGILSRPTQLPAPESTIAGRDQYLFELATTHRVLGTEMLGPWPANLEIVYFGMGCFWGVERLFYQIPGVYVTAAGYQGGTTNHPTYEEVCTGMTGHTESVLVVFDPAQVSFKSLLKIFWEEHDPTSGMRQGNDIGTQYRSAIYLTSPEQLAIAEQTKFDYQTQLAAANLDQITTEIKLAPQFFYAEIYHQQYLDRVPNGYCGLKGTGVSCIS